MVIITFTVVGSQRITINGTPVTVTSRSIYKTNCSYVTIQQGSRSEYKSGRLGASDLLEVVITQEGDIVCRSERLNGQRQGFLSLHATELPSAPHTTPSAEEIGTVGIIFGVICLAVAYITLETIASALFWGIAGAAFLLYGIHKKRAANKTDERRK